MNLTAALTHSLIQQQITPCSIINKSFIKITPDNLLKIEKINITFPKKYFIFNDPVPQCCVYGKCKDCCISKECSTNISLYPIIIVHGHAFSKDTAADYSLDSFKKLQNKLEEDNYLNAGAISLYTPVEDIGAGWSILPVPISLKVSYYYDLFKEPENYITIQTKSENIDTYALRLKDLIDKVTSKTNKQKVIIIAHSMGGLVSRRYLQIFGNNSVEQLIMIGTPNNGISGNTLGYCSWIGEQLECRDMSSDSLFLNKLNRGQLIFVQTTNIIGSGCSMDLGDGDGTVLVEKAWLEGAQNYIINGTCPSIDQPLHMKMLDNHAYPEVYNVIKSVLMR
jgi:pimeloyl-ACP methyl ester carboxylesterase